MSFSTMRLPADPTVTAPDGSDVRILLGVRGASTAHFELAPGQVAAPVRHRTVDEVWFVLAGDGRIWRRLGEVEEIVRLEPGVCLDIPVGTSFQFRCDGDEPLGILGCTSPPWPGDDEAEPVDGPWSP
jgi:mannose-6-phosphate isomerase-like protein (cupin superfamily)